MPRRQVILANEQIYHVFNKGVASLPIFKSVYDYQRLVELIDFYRFNKPPIRYSHFKRLTATVKEDFLSRLHREKRLVDIFAFTLMPNHYHFQLKQLMNSGIQKFIGNIQNAYARFFNIKYKGLGSLFQLRFKAVRIENEEQYLHVNRYIHLNPLTSYLIKKPEELIEYQWTSFKNYMGNNNNKFIQTNFILKMFQNNKEKFLKFTLDNIDYQRKLAGIKHFIID